MFCIGPWVPLPRDPSSIGQWAAPHAGSRSHRRALRKQAQSVWGQDPMNSDDATRECADAPARPGHRKPDVLRHLFDNPMDYLSVSPDGGLMR